MSMLTNLDLIRRVPLFSMLTLDQAAVLSAAVTKRRFKRGQLMVEQGKKTDALFIILAGRARVLLTDGKSREVTLASLKPGDYFGEMSMIDNQPHSASVEAEVQTDVLVLGRVDFTRCLVSSSLMACGVVQGLVQRLRNADEQIGSLALLGVYDRVAKVLMGCAAPDGEQKMVIREKISRQNIAKMVGASREMVSRVMRDLEDQGFIETREDGSIVVNERRTVPR
jgi:CRP-like cAMP-binding protein